MQTKVRVGVPVHVHFAGEGDARVVNRVILDEDYELGSIQRAGSVS